jgi:hypothetical protein
MLARGVFGDHSPIPMPRIRSLKPNVTREEAVEQLSGGGVLNWLRDLSLGPLRSVGEIYIPFKLFDIKVSNREQHEQHFLALDAVSGTLDLYHFDQIPSSWEVIVLESRNCLPAELEDARATELVTEKFRRVLFNRGFFRLGALRIAAVTLPGEIHIPYWIGFRGRGGGVHLEVMDAVRRRVEGAKVRKLVETWLASTR